MNKKRFLTLMGNVSQELNIVCPAITPTLGDELVINPGLEAPFNDLSAGGGGTINVADGWAVLNLELDGTDLADQETTIKHGGSSSQKITTDANSEGIQQAAVLATQGWYQIGCWSYLVAGGTITIRDTNNRFKASQIAKNTWSNIFATNTTSGANKDVYIVVATGAPSEYYIDDVSAKTITFSSMLTYLGARKRTDGTFICTPTVTDKTQAGMAIQYKDANNYLLVYVERNANIASISTCIGGTYTENVVTGAITYVESAPLKVVASGGNYTLYYNNIQVGSETAISETTLGKEVYGFSAYSENSVGTVTTSPF